MDKDHLKQVLRDHEKWLRGEEGGKRANLSGADLSRADLSRASLTGADLSGADLSRADLSRASLYGASLYGADLSGANLYGADLSGADLSRADLSRASLYGAKDAALVIARNSICPAGELIVWKKGHAGHVIQLRIPADAKRINALGSRKCRSDYAIVLAITNAEGKAVDECGGWKKQSFMYRVGQEARCEEAFDESITEECASGIHWWLTREEAGAWN